MPAIPTARVDHYAFSNEELRVRMAETLARVGRVDCADPAEVHEVCDEVRALVARSHAHLGVEEMRRLLALVEQLDHSWIDERRLAVMNVRRALQRAAGRAA